MYQNIKILLTVPRTVAKPKQFLRAVRAVVKRFIYMFCIPSHDGPQKFLTFCNCLWHGPLKSTCFCTFPDLDTQRPVFFFLSQTYLHSNVMHGRKRISRKYTKQRKTTQAKK